MTKENTSFMYPILMTAKVHVDMMGAEANDVLNQYESLATALCKHKGLDVKAEIDEYNRELKEFIGSDETVKPIVPKDCIHICLKMYQRQCSMPTGINMVISNSRK